MEYSDQEKLIIMAILIAIMEADTIIDPRETAFLDEIALSFGFTEPDIQRLDDIDLSLAIQIFKTFSPAKKEAAKEMFVKMAQCDGFVDPRELRVIEAL